MNTKDGGRPWKGRRPVWALAALVAVSSCAGSSAVPPPGPPSPGPGVAAIHPAPEQGIGGGALPKEDAGAELLPALSFLIQRPSLAESCEFIPAPAEIPALATAIPPAAGILTWESADAAAGLEEAEKGRLSGAFREAYLDGLLRGLPLAGVLGGDLVHGWPGNEPLCWAQNWRLSRDYPNSWGIPSLALALAGRGGDTVFLVWGAILDRYGRTGGRNGANGAAGYGAPLGNEWYYRGGKFQRFEEGHILTGGDGAGRFSPLTEEQRAVPPLVGEAAGPAGAAGLPGAVTAAFRSAWAGLPFDGDTPLIPDEGVFRLSLSPASPEGPPAGAETLYLQSFNQGRAFLALSDSPALPFRARLLRGPFLDALLLAPAERLAGAAPLSPADLAGIRLEAGGREIPLRAGGPGDPYPLGSWGALIRSLAGGLGFYGIPLSDPLPLEAGEGGLSPGESPDSPAGGDGESPAGPALMEAQRFSRGWMLNRRP